MAPETEPRAHRDRLRAALTGGRQRGRFATLARGAGRAVVLALANALFPRPKPSAIDRGAIRKLLVIRVDERVGNQLLTTPLLRALKLGLPSAELHLLAPRQAKAIAPPHVDRLWLWQKRDSFRAPHRFLGLLRALRREKFDVVVEAGHWSAFPLTAVLLARAVGGRVTVGHDRGEAAPPGDEREQRTVGRRPRLGELTPRHAHLDGDHAPPTLGASAPCETSLERMHASRHADRVRVRSKRRENPCRTSRLR